MTPDEWKKESSKMIEFLEKNTKSLMGTMRLLEKAESTTKEEIESIRHLISKNVSLITAIQSISKSNKNAKKTNSNALVKAVEADETK